MDPVNPISGNPMAVGSVPETPQPPKDSHWITILAMALFVLLSLGAVVFLYYQNQQLKTMLASYQTPIASPTPTATPDVTANWKVYTSSEFGFSFKYPETIVVSQKTQGKEVIINLKGLSNDIALVIDPISDHDFYQEKTLTSTTTFNDIKWNYLTGGDPFCDGGECTPISDALQTTTKTERYTIVLGGLPYPDETINQILSTFKFLEPVQTSEESDVRNFVDLYAKTYVAGDWSTLKTLLTTAMASDMTQNQTNLQTGGYLFTNYQIISINKNTNPVGYKATIRFFRNGQPVYQFPNSQTDPQIIIVKENGQWKSMTWYLYQ